MNLNVLTLVMILLKAFGLITLSWWIVFAPSIVALVLSGVATVFTLFVTDKALKNIR